MVLRHMAVTAGISILVCCVLCKEEQRPELGEQACLSGLAPEFLCTMQLALNTTQQGPLERSLQNRVDLPPNDTARMGFTVDPLLQTRYLGAGGELRPWLPEAPSVFPDQQLAVSGSSGGFLSGKQVKTTAFVDYFWCSDSSCEAVLDLAYVQNEQTGTCDYGFALAVFPTSVAGFGLPHSIEPEPQPQDFVARDIPAMGGSSVQGSLRCNTYRGQRVAGTLVDGSIHVVPTRSAAQFIDQRRSALAGFVGVYEYLGQCTTFLLPDSHWYASKQLFTGWQGCSDSSNTVLLLGVAGPAVGYTAGSSVYDTKGVGDLPRISIWPAIGMPCKVDSQRTSLYRTCLIQDERCQLALVDGQLLFDDCSPDLGNPGCFLLVNVTMGPGPETLTLWGVNITAQYQPSGAGGAYGGVQKPVAIGSYPPRFSSLFASAVAEATMYPNQPVACLHAPGGSPLNTSLADYNYTLDVALRQCSSLVQLSLQQCYTHGNDSTPRQGTWAFLRAFTNTVWLTNSSSIGAEGALDCVWHNAAVHGFGPVNMASVGLALTVLGTNVQRELLLASSGALSNIDSILKWPGALFLFVLSFIAAIGAVSQGRDLWDSMNRRSWSYWVMLLVTVFVVGVGALLPVGFAAAGELTSYSNNKQIDGISYLQLAVDIPDYQAVSVKGSQQLVALVALKTSYESSIAVPGVLYGFTTAVILAILAYSWWRWFSPSKCAALALGAAAHSQLQTTPLLSQAAPAAAAAAAGTSAPPAASGSPSKRSGSLSKHKSANGSLELVLPQQHAVPAGVSTPQQVARTVSAPQQASGGDRAPRALSHRHRVLTL